LAGRLENLVGVRLDEILWAETAVVPQLASTMQASALAHGWRFIDAHVPSFDGHGYCADANWIVRVPQSILAQVRPSYGTLGEVALNALNGSVHPNAQGHEAYAAAILSELLCDFYPDCNAGTVPRAPRPSSRPIPGTKLVVSDPPTKPAKRRISLVAKSALIEAPTPGADDPTELGGVLRVANPQSGDDDARFPLSAAGWKGLGKPAGAKGYKYSDPRRDSGPCTSVTVKQGKSVKATCKGAAIPFTLDEPTQDALGVSLTLGNDATQCMEFGGIVQKDRPAIGKKAGVFQAKNAPAPARCPLP
jgi:hypothetical protein